MKKAKTNIIHEGFRLFINPTGNPGQKNWMTVGFLEPSKHKAELYRLENHSGSKKYRIEGVRLDHTRLEKVSDKPESV